MDRGYFCPDGCEYVRTWKEYPGSCCRGLQKWETQLVLGCEMVFIHKEKHYKSLAGLPPIRKKEHLLTYFSSVLGEVHKQKKELNTSCKLLKRACSSLLQPQVKIWPGSEFCIAHHVFLRVPTEVPRCSFITFKAAHRFCTCTDISSEVSRSSWRATSVLGCTAPRARHSTAKFPVLPGEYLDRGTSFSVCCTHPAPAPVPLALQFSLYRLRAMQDRTRTWLIQVSFLRNVSGWFLKLQDYHMAWGLMHWDLVISDIVLRLDLLFIWHKRAMWR